MRNNKEKFLIMGTVVIVGLLLLMIIGLAWRIKHNNLNKHSTQAQGVDVNLKKELQNNPHTWAGAPEVEEDKIQILQREGYISGYSLNFHCPRWVAYKIKAEFKPVSGKRSNTFFPDPQITPRDRVTTREFNNSGFDRGHMAPNWAVSISYGRNAQLETFLLTNVCPQKPSLNRGIWEQLERIEANDYARRYNGVNTFDGPVFKSLVAQENEGIGENGRIKIPEKFYKIILANKNSSLDCLAFEIPQNAVKPKGDARKELEKYLVRVKDIEEETKIKFFGNLSKEDKEGLELKKANRIW